MSPWAYKMQIPHSYKMEKMKSFKAQSFTVPICKRSFMFDYFEPGFLGKRAHTVENGVSWKNQHSASEFQQLLNLASPPQDSKWVDERRQSSHPVKATLLGCMPTWSTPGRAWCCWSLRGEEEKLHNTCYWNLHCIIVYKGFFTSIILFEPHINHWRFILPVPYVIHEEIIL